MRARTKRPASAPRLLTGMLLTSLFLTGCQSVNSAIDGVGGLFTNKKSASCKGESCADDNLPGNARTGSTWYCYGVAKGADWDCQEQADPGKIVAIRDTVGSAVTAKPAAN